MWPSPKRTFPVRSGRGSRRCYLCILGPESIKNVNQKELHEELGLTARSLIWMRARGGGGGGGDTPAQLPQSEQSFPIAQYRGSSHSLPLAYPHESYCTLAVIVIVESCSMKAARARAAGGSLTVGGSQLVGADGSADPFPCDGTLPDCAGEHAGSVVVEGPSAINMAAPLVCNTESGGCLSDLCFVVDCGEYGSCISPRGTCECQNGYGGDHCDVSLWHFGSRGESCSSVCSTAHLPCTDGDWGVHDEASSRAAIQVAGEDPDQFGTGGIGQGTLMGASALGWAPAASTNNGWYYWKSEPISSCGPSDYYRRRLCLCI